MLAKFVIPSDRFSISPLRGLRGCLILLPTVETVGYENVGRNFKFRPAKDVKMPIEDCHAERSACTEQCRSEASL